MSEGGWGTVLVLGGIQSGKTAFAESLVTGAPAVRRIVTALPGHDDVGSGMRLAEQASRPDTWTTEQVGADPARLARMIGEAKSDEALLVDDIAGWVTALLSEVDAAEVTPSFDAVVDAIRACPARLVLVSAEVGLSGM